MAWSGGATGWKGKTYNKYCFAMGSQESAPQDDCRGHVPADDHQGFRNRPVAPVELAATSRMMIGIEYAPDPTSWGSIFIYMVYNMFYKTKKTSHLNTERNIGTFISSPFFTCLHVGYRKTDVHWRWHHLD